VKSKREPGRAAQLLYSIIAGLIIGISALTIYLVQERLRGPETGAAEHFSVEGEANFDGAIPIQPPIELPEFTLSNQDGEAASLRDLRGRYTLLTFGFTNCPDICPLTLNDFERVADMLGDQAKGVAFVFVSVDGRRDTPAMLRDYLDFRDMEGIIGLTGDEEAVREFGAPLGLSFEIPDSASTGAYSVNHSAGSYLLDRQARWIKRYQFGLPPSRIATDLNALLKR